MKQIYHLPVKVEIESDNPDVVMRRIAETIHDALDEYTSKDEFAAHVPSVNIEYSIYVRPDHETFGRE